MDGKIQHHRGRLTMTDGEHKHRQFMARMNYSTYMRLRCQFKALNRNESAKDYFLRLAKHLEAQK